MGLGGESSYSGDSTEKYHQEKCPCARAEETERTREGLAMTGKDYFLVDAEARAKLPREVELSDLDHSPWEIVTYVTVNGYSKSSCWKGPLLASTSSVWLHGSKGTKTLSGRRKFRAQDLGFFYAAPTIDDCGEEINEL